MERELSELRKRINELEEEVARLTGECERLSTDAVTGLSGRGVLERAMRTEFARGQRFGRKTAIVMIDIDLFKKVNDTHGHQIGDEVLWTVGQTLRTFVRGSDTLSRYGGEEFAIILDGSNPEGAALVCERIRDGIERLRATGCPPVTVSIGWAIENTTDTSAAQILHRADLALYAAKDAGRNCVRRG